ncbi:hypothetical protein GCM10029978_064320 [Actinoallomurus acanthiterrae]
MGLTEDLFADVAPRVLASWRARVGSEAPSHLCTHPYEIKVTLLAAYLSCRGREITDTLVDLLISTVQRINARADTKVTNDFLMMKYATAIRFGTASDEALLRRFTSETTHPAYAGCWSSGGLSGRSSWPAGSETATCSGRPSQG